MTIFAEPFYMTAWSSASFYRERAWVRVETGANWDQFLLFLFRMWSRWLGIWPKFSAFSSSISFSHPIFSTSTDIYLTGSSSAAADLDLLCLTLNPPPSVSFNFFTTLMCFLRRSSPLSLISRSCRSKSWYDGDSGRSKFKTPLSVSMLYCTACCQSSVFLFYKYCK